MEVLRRYARTRPGAREHVFPADRRFTACRSCPRVPDCARPGVPVSYPRSVVCSLTENGGDARVVRCAGVVFSAPVGRARSGSLRVVDEDLLAAGAGDDVVAEAEAETPSQVVSSFDQPVTEWMSTMTVSLGSAREPPPRTRPSARRPRRSRTSTRRAACAGSARARAPGSRTCSGRTGLGWDRRPCTLGGRGNLGRRSSRRPTLLRGRA